MRHISIFLLGSLVLLAACGKATPGVPENSRDIDETTDLFPDYTDIVVPPNIAPLNVAVNNEGDAFVLCLESDGGGSLVAASDKGDNIVQFPEEDWHDFLEKARGTALRATLYAQRGEEWARLAPYTITVAEETIDPYMSYRLIEPGYELYRQLGLYQRNLTNFEQTPIYENNYAYEDEHNHCVNCHNYQNNDAQRTLFHVRAKHGGTVIIENGKAEKLNFTTDSTLGSAVYPAWHPTENLIAFSSNLTGQAFHLGDKQKIEVVDYGSDLLLYDVEKHTVTNIAKTLPALETFPTWSADGTRLYFCMAYIPDFMAYPEEQHPDITLTVYNKICYHLMSLDFDIDTHAFSNLRMEINADSVEHRSISVPRVSPDGRYILFTLGDFGQFHIWHKSSDLYVKDLLADSIYPLTEANSPDVDSYHSWSSNGRWIVFSSRRDDGNYTRPYFAYFDKDGQAHKAFMLPQEDPKQNIRLLKSYNVPELSRSAVKTTAEELREYIYSTEGTPVTYLSQPYCPLPYVSLLIGRPLTPNDSIKFLAVPPAGATPKQKKHK